MSTLNPEPPCPDEELLARLHSMGSRFPRSHMEALVRRMPRLGKSLIAYLQNRDLWVGTCIHEPAVRNIAYALAAAAWPSVDAYRRVMAWAVRAAPCTADEDNIDFAVVNTLMKALRGGDREGVDATLAGLDRARAWWLGKEIEKEGPPGSPLDRSGPPENYAAPLDFYDDSGFRRDKRLFPPEEQIQKWLDEGSKPLEDA